MSINKILNRPIFRKVALKKGHLKPIHAQTGVMVGQPYTPPPPPAVRPGIFRRGIRAIGTPAFGFGYGLTDSAIGGIAPNMNPYAREATNVGAGLGLNALALRYAPAALSSGFLPATLALGIGYGTGELVKAGIKERKRIKAMSPKEYEAFKNEQEAKAFSYFGDGLSDADLFGNIKPKVVDEVSKKSATTVPNPGAGRPSSKFYQQKETDVATEPDNVTKFGKDKLIDTAKIAENAADVNSGRGGDSASAIAREKTLPEPEAPKVEGAPVLDKDKEKDQGTGIGGEIADKNSVASGSALKMQLDEAERMVRELRKGKGSNANLVFLTNLASGLLTGKTTKSGLGGAMEVFGAALGPAVNNMVMVKMKEDEISDNLLGRVLDFQSDFLKAQNESFDMPDVSEVGVIQYTNAAGRTINVAGRILKDGTKQINTGKKDANGLNIFTTVDPGLNFISNKDQNTETLDIAKQIAGKYAAVNLINRSLGILTEGKARGGVTGAIELYGGRLSEALGDVFSFVKLQGDDSRSLNTQGKKIFEMQQAKAAADLVAMEPGIFKNKQQALNYLKREIGSYEKFKGNALKDAKKRLEGGSKLDYERLAINETVLVYKLANSLKSKDRLTQKDIDMAKNLVKVFPMFRGDENVRASLIATAETILDDIKQQERLYERAGGSSQYLLDERKAYDLVPSDMSLNDFTETFEKLKKTEKEINDLTEDDLKIIFPGLQ